MKQEIELKEGMTAKVEGGKLVIEMPGKYTPKKGDFVTCDRNTQGNKWIMIWGGVSPSGVFTSEAVAYNEILGLTVGGHCCRIDDNFRPSTQTEKGLLLDVLKKKGLTWNAEKRAIEKLRWRAEPGGSYEYVNSCCGRALSSETCDDLAFLHNWRFESGNYYKPGSGQAQKAADKINEIFKNNE